MAAQTEIFSKRVRDVMGAPPVACGPGTKLADVVALLSRSGQSSAVVVDADRRPVGILTEQDIARRVTFQHGPEIAVEAVMTRPVAVAEADDYLYRAIARMRRQHRRHMPVVDDGHRLVGMLDLTETLAAAASRTMGQIERLTQEGDVAGLRQVKAAQADIAEELLEDNLPAPDIQALLTDINRDIHRHLAETATQAMQERGRGPPPVASALIVMGSGGRGESFLFPDQDNGFIIADYPDDAHDRIDGYFIEFATKLTADLDAIGIPYCQGHVMATNPLWRKTLSQWRHQVALWAKRRGGEAVLNADIFFDFQPVWGEAALAAALRADITKIAASHPNFLATMARDDSGHGVGLDWLGRFRTGTGGRFDIKRHATVPLVESVRLLALVDGLEQTSTLGRLGALRARGRLDANDHDELVAAFEHIGFLLLRQQLADYRAGRPVGNLVRLESMSRPEKSALRRALKSIGSFRRRARADATGEILGG